jgi:hypothetical protein
VHDLRNAGDAPATSIHVYAPPLSTMTFYHRRTEYYLKPLRIEVVARADDSTAPRRSIDQVRRRASTSAKSTARSSQFS